MGEDPGALVRGQVGLHESLIRWPGGLVECREAGVQVEVIGVEESLRDEPEALDELLKSIIVDFETSVDEYQYRL